MAKAERKLCPCDKQFRRQVLFLVGEFKLIKDHGRAINLTRLSKALGISRQMLRLWITPKNRHYRPKFAKVVKEATQRFCST